MTFSRIFVIQTNKKNFFFNINMKKLSWINIYRQNILQGNSFPWSELLQIFLNLNSKINYIFLKLDVEQVQTDYLYQKSITIQA